MYNSVALRIFPILILSNDDDVSDLDICLQNIVFAPQKDHGISSVIIVCKSFVHFLFQVQIRIKFYSL